MSQRVFVLLIVVITLPALAMAHTGVGSVSGFVSGFGHPVAGIDHLLAMVAVGLWAAYLGGRSLWAVPLTFVLVMVIGGLVGLAGFSLPYTEQGIILSVLVFGFLVVAAMRLPLIGSVLIVGVFALFHGHAHGSEIPLTVGATAYMSGFMLATALLHSIGLSVGLIMQYFNSTKVRQLAGGTIMLCAVYLTMA